MSFLFSCCDQGVDYDDKIEDIITEKKISGKDRILRLNQQESFQEYTKYFQNEYIKNIFDKDNSSPKDIFNLKQKNFLFNNSNPCYDCGEENCKDEDFSLNKDFAIEGLNSSLFFDCIYASQRPSTALIKKYDLINSFIKNNIKLIVNCQIHGEHPKCGPNKTLEPDSGYAYSPSEFMAEDIDVLNCGFEEETAPYTLDFMLDIVKKISYVIKYKNGRVLVHGHSANGRTCLVIVCFLIYYFNKTAKEALNIVRKKRENAINNDSQEEYANKFEIYVNILKKVFPRKQIAIDNHVKYQMDMDFSFGKSTEIPYIISLIFKDYIKEKENNININKKLSNIINIKYVPKIIIICLDKIIQLKDKNIISNDYLYQILNGMNNISDEEIKQLESIKKQINKNNWELLINNENLSIIAELLFSWMNESVKECISPKKISILWNKCSLLLNENKYNKNINTNTNSNNNSVKKNFFNEFMKGNYLLTKDGIIEFLSLVQTIFSKTECELIKYISLFLILIYPKLDPEDKNNKNTLKEFKRFIYKLCLFLLGYNLDKVNSLSNKNNLKEMKDVKRLFLILEFFIFYVSKENNVIKSPNNANNDWIQNYLNLKAKYNENNNNIDEDNIIEFFKKKPENGLISIKLFLIHELMKNKEEK